MERHRRAHHQEASPSDEEQTSIDGDENLGSNETDLSTGDGVMSEVSSHDSDAESQDESRSDEESSSDEEESSSGEESSSDEDEDTIWDDIRDLSWTSSLLHTHKEKKEELIGEGMAVHDANQEAYYHVLPRLRRNILTNYIQKVVGARKLQKDPIHKKIMSTKRKLQYDEDYEPEEALKYAVKKRKYIIQEATATLSDDELEDEEEDDGDEEEYT